MEKLTIAQAAAHLSLSQDTVRRRLRNGEIDGHQEPCAGGFKWIVDLDAAKDSGDASVITENGATNSDLVEMLKGQVHDLRDQLDTRAREISELHQLLAARSLAPGVIRPWWAFWRR